MPSQKIAWLEAAWIFLSSRLVILFVTVVASLRISSSGQSFWLSWLHWDVFSYIGVAFNGGYDSVRNTVFFPLWPLLLRLVGAPSGGSSIDYYIAGLLLANVFFYFSLVLFYFLLIEHYDATITRNALFYMAFSPYAVFFFLGYTESLFLFLFLAAFLCIQNSRYWLAAVCGFLAALTHSQGVLLVVPLAVVILQRFWLPKDEQQSFLHRLRAFLPLLLVPMGVVCYMVYLEITKHAPLAFSTAEAQSWQRTLAIPPVSIVRALQALFHSSPASIHVDNFLDLVFTLLPFAILVKGWKAIPLHYALFALALCLFNISYPYGTIEPLAAAPRYMLVVFPIFVILGLWGKRPVLDRIIVVFSVALFALNILLFVEHYWVA